MSTLTNEVRLSLSFFHIRLRSRLTHDPFYYAPFVTLAGNLLRIPDLIPVSIEQAIENYNVPGVIKEQIGALAEFIRDCLNLDPAQRKTAGDLQNHGFFNVVGPC